jgi:hypothetical protein
MRIRKNLSKARSDDGHAGLCAVKNESFARESFKFFRVAMGQPVLRKEDSP